MHKRELVARAARRTSLTQKQTRQTLDALLEEIVEALIAGEAVTLLGFGRFETKEYKGRRVVGPLDKQPYDTLSRPVPAFRPYPELRRRVQEESALRRMFRSRPSAGAEAGR